MRFSVNTIAIISSPLPVSQDSCLTPIPQQFPRTLRERLMSMPDHLEERAIIGTPQDCRRRIAELRDELGVEHLAFYFQAGARDLTHARQGLELFAREVMPEFR